MVEVESNATVPLEREIVKLVICELLLHAQSTIEYPPPDTALVEYESLLTCMILKSVEGFHPSHL